MKTGFKRWLRNTLLAGLLAVLPLFLTIWALRLLFRWVDGFLAPVTSLIIIRLSNLIAGTEFPPGTRIPGIGIATTLLIIFLVGLLVRNVVSRRLFSLGTRLLERIPIFGVLFHSMEQFLGLFMKKRSFSKVVAVEYPLRGTWAFAFVTGTVGAEDVAHVGKPMSYVFIATTPNPTTGFVLLVPDEEIVELPITVEEGIKLIVSAGVLSRDMANGGKTE
jgi:uncharacterized membrane protein